MAYGMLYPYLKVGPATERVRLVVEDGRLQVGTRRFRVTWIDASPLLGKALIETHFMAEEDGEKSCCPRCENKEARRLAGLPLRARLTQKDRLLITIRDNTDASHACGNCGYAWIEVDIHATLSLR